MRKSLLERRVPDSRLRGNDRWFLSIAFLFLFVSFFFGCNAFLEEIGGEGQSCSVKNTCRGDLVCKYGICVNLDAGDGDEETVSDDNEEIVTDGDEEIVADGDEADREDIEEDGDSDSFACSNGICKDLMTGFEWQDTPTGGLMEWTTAKTHCQELTLDGTGWRLPNISELRSLIRNCTDIETSGVCEVKDVCSACGVNSDDACLKSWCWSDSCAPDSCSDNGGSSGCYWPEELSGTCSYHWSSSPVEDVYNLTWGVYFNVGRVRSNNVAGNYGVRCVR